MGSFALSVLFILWCLIAYFTYPMAASVMVGGNWGEPGENP